MLSVKTKNLKVRSHDMEIKTQQKVCRIMDYLISLFGALALTVWNALKIIATGRLIATVL